MNNNNKSQTCCICLEQHNEAFLCCNTCKECNICYDCNASLMETGKLDKCPICRSKNWRDTKKIYDVIVENPPEYHSYLVPIAANVSGFNSAFSIIKCIVLMFITWLFGFCVFMIYHKKFNHSFNVFTILLPFIPGMLIVWLCIWCYKFRMRIIQHETSW